MAIEDFEHATGPTGALSAEDLEVGGHLGPADGVGEITDLVVDLFFAVVAVQTDGQFHVFTDGVVEESAHLDDGRAFEQAERAGDDGDALGLAPG
jgi:hypothetical protein